MSEKRYHGSKDSTAPKSEGNGFWWYTKKLLLNACVIYTVIVLFLAVIISALSTGADEGAVFYSDLILIYPLSFLIACANMFFANERFNFWLRLISHMLIIFAGFSLYMLTVKQYEINSIVMLTPVFVFVYALVMTVMLVARNIRKAHERDNAEYTDVYANVKNNVRGQRK